MCNLPRNCLLFLLTLLFTIHTSLAINCYQCTGSDSSKPFQCNEYLSSDIDLQAESCDNVFGAQYCVKHIGRFEGAAINCYQCSSSKSIDCSDGMIHLGGIQPQNCDNVFEAEYCVKSISLDGGIGAKRFCSSLDLGNYCNYVKQPGDQLNYRTCIFTCTGDGCNAGVNLSPKNGLMVLVTVVLVFFVGR